jgi:hypothetical protein
MLIPIIVIWLALIAFFVVLCRAAAAGDGRDLAAVARYPSVEPVERQAPVEHPSAKARGVRGRAGQYVAGS